MKLEVNYHVKFVFHTIDSWLAEQRYHIGKKVGSTILLTPLDKGFPGMGSCEERQIAQGAKGWRNGYILKAKYSYQLGHKF